MLMKDRTTIGCTKLRLMECATFNLKLLLRLSNRFNCPIAWNNLRNPLTNRIVSASSVAKRLRLDLL